MKDIKRALRRHHRLRMIARMQRIILSTGWNLTEEDRLQRVLRLYNNRKICSCAMCCNPRKWEGPTVQERRQSSGKMQDLEWEAFSVERPSWHE